MPSVTLQTAANGHIILLSDQIYDIALVDEDAAGNQVPVPAGDVQTVSATGAFAASLTFSIGTMPGVTPTVPSLHVVSNVLESDAGNSGGGIGVSLTDTQGLPMAPHLSALLFDISPDLAAATQDVNLGDVNATPNPTPPTAPGP